ncbi:MAG TPA: tetratricopeptide repeat protein [Polyangiaceae bacterium]|nr:tetratricopeptide repeat protein [Polyangiaceae bacterium]
MRQHRARVGKQRKTRAFVAAVALLAGLSLACSAPQSAPRQNRESLSIAEYDIARDLWLTRGQPREALDHVLKAIDLDDDNADAAHLAALIYLDFCRQDAEECRLAEAEKQARRALALKPDFRDARNTLGVVLVHEKRYAEAIEVLTPLTSDILYRTPENAWGNIGWAYLEKGDLPRALEALKRSVAAQPDFCVGYYRLGLTEERLGRSNEAIEAYTQALSAADGRCQGLQEAYAGRARLLTALNRLDEARRDLETCVRLDERTDAGQECLRLQQRLGLQDSQNSPNLRRGSPEDHPQDKKESPSAAAPPQTPAQ